MKYNNALYPDKINDLIGNDGNFTELGKQLVQAAAGGEPSPSGGSKILYYNGDEMLDWSDESNPFKEIPEAQFSAEFVAAGLSQVYDITQVPVLKFKILSMEELLNFFDINPEKQEIKSADVRISLYISQIGREGLSHNNIVLNKFSDAEQGSVIFFYAGDFVATVFPSDSGNFILAIANYFGITKNDVYEIAFDTKDLTYDPKDPEGLNNNVFNLREYYKNENLNYTGRYGHKEYEDTTERGRYLMSCGITGSPIYITEKNSFVYTKLEYQGIILIVPFGRGEKGFATIGTDGYHQYSINFYELTDLVTYPDIPTEEGDYHLKVSIDSEGAKTFTGIKDE